MNVNLHQQLQEYYTNFYPSKVNAQVSSPVMISSGWESDVYAFDLASETANERSDEKLILRLYPGVDAIEKSAHEFKSMTRLYDAGYPIPKVFRLEQENSPFGKPFVIMERVEGKPMGESYSSLSEATQAEYQKLFCKLLYELHTLDWRPFVDDRSEYDNGNPYIFVDREFGKIMPYIERFPIGGLAPIVDWLKAHREDAPCPAPSPIHWDFHRMNIMVREDGSAAVIDWTQFDVSDFRFDLAWTLIQMGPDLRDATLGEYERLAGSKVEELEFFDVFACLKRLGSVLLSFQYGPEQLGMRPEAVKLMISRLESLRPVYDLLVERTGIRVPEIEEMFASNS